MVRRDDPSDPLAETAAAGSPDSGATPENAETAEASPDSAVASVRVRGPVIPKDTKVGRYVITEQLGAGGMGTVYAAKDPELGRRVAIKLLHPHLADLEARLLREGQAIAKLRHPNVVTIHDVGTHDGNLFIAMEYVGGGTLRTWLQTQRPWPEVLDAFLAAGRGLAAAHAKGLVHRDFKPDNVLIDDAGHVIVTDFGLARESPEDDDSPKRAAQSTKLVEMTQTGSYVGTPAYMSPEQFRGEPADARSDQFSFCVALYEALYGKRPFTGPNVKTFDEMQKSVLESAPAAAPSGTLVPAHVHAAIDRGLAKAPAERHPSMNALLAALAPPAKKRNRLWLVVPAVAVVLTVPLVVMWQLKQREKKVVGVDFCVGRSKQIDRAWNEGSRTMFHVRQRSGGLDVLPIFELFAGDWQFARLEACRTKNTKAEECLDAELSQFSSTLAEHQPGDLDWPALPSLARCTEGGASPTTKVIRSKTHDQVALSPDGTLFATFRDGTITLAPVETGIEQKPIPVPGGKFLVGWHRDRELVIAHKDLERLLTVELESGQIGESVFAHSALAVSPDLQSALVIENGDVRLESLVTPNLSRTIDRLELTRQHVLAHAFSPSGGRLALILGPPSDAQLRIYDTSNGKANKIPFHANLKEPGPGALLWRDNTRLLYVSDGVWSARIDDELELAESPERRMSPPDAATTYELLGVANGHVLARVIRRSHEVAFLRGAKEVTFPVSVDMRRLKSVTSDGKRIAVECVSDAGWYDLDKRTYVKVGERDDVVAANGERVLVTHGDQLVSVAPDGDQENVATLAASSVRRTISCANPGGLCAILSWGGSSSELRLLRDKTLGPPYQFNPDFLISDLAVRADQKKLAVVGSPREVPIHDVDTSGEVMWALPPDERCTTTTYGSWSPVDNSLFVSQACEGGARLLQLRGPKASTAIVRYQTPDQIAGFAVATNGDIYLDRLHRDADLVVIDGL